MDPGNWVPIMEAVELGPMPPCMGMFCIPIEADEVTLAPEEAGFA